MNTNRKFDRLVQFDERSRSYGIAEKVSAVTPIKKYWTENAVLDQGREGACVGFGWTGELIASPKPSVIAPDRANVYALGVYNRAKKLDSWPGVDYEGTSVIAGAKVMLERKYITSYLWAFDILQVRDAVITQGPVVIGVNWHEGMYDTAPNGLVDVSGPIVGGHCLLLTGYNPRARLTGLPGYHEVFRWKNSWGAGYGVNGSGYIKIADLAALLANQGDACIPQGRQRVRF